MNNSEYKDNLPMSCFRKDSLLKSKKIKKKFKEIQDGNKK